MLLGRTLGGHATAGSQQHNQQTGTDDGPHRSDRAWHKGAGGFAAFCCCLASGRDGATRRVEHVSCYRMPAHFCHPLDTSEGEVPPAVSENLTFVRSLPVYVLYSKSFHSKFPSKNRSYIDLLVQFRGPTYNRFFDDLQLKLFLCLFDRGWHPIARSLVTTP